MANVSTTETAATSKRAPTRQSLAPAVDYATVCGVIGAFVLISLAMVLGGTPQSFVDLPALLIVFGGTFMVTAVSFSVAEVVRAQSVMWRAVVYHVDQPAQAAEQILYLADLSRKKGKLALQGVMEDFRQNAFLYRAITLVVDGVPSEEVERILNHETHSTHARHQRSAGVLRRAGEVAPAMGLIGTLVGLVQMLGNLDDPATIGPSMAVALLTTFYGAILANMVFIPLAGKLERNAQVEATVNQIHTIAAASISRQENPRRLEMMVNTVLPPEERVNYFD